jgi:hypothetical protein
MGSIKSHDEIAYAAYTQFCARVDVTPLSFENWYKKCEKLNPADNRAARIFHKNAGPTWSDESDHPSGNHWDGSWDNAVRAIEDAPEKVRG